MNKMDELDCKATINQDNNEIIIAGLKNNIVLNYTDDIDFTNLISELTISIDEGNTVKLSLQETKDEKETLILNTINEIFDEYNNCLKRENTTEEIW